MTPHDKKQILSIAEKILEAVTGLQQSVNALAEYQKAYYESRKPEPSREPQRVSTEIYFEPKEAERYYSEQAKAYSIQRVAAWVGFFTLIVLGIYTGYTKQQAHAAIDAANAAKISADAAKRAADATAQSNTDARNRFLQDQRPYLWLIKNNPVMGFVQRQGQPLGQVIWDWHITNYGKSPAYNVQIHEYISVGKGPYVPPYGSKGLGFKNPPLPPTAEMFKTIISDPIPTSKFSTLKETFEGVRIKVRISYEDGSHTQYETGLCLGNIQASVSSNTFDYCEGANGNYIK